MVAKTPKKNIDKKSMNKKTKKTVLLFDRGKIERLLILANAEFKLRYYGNKLGLLWALIGPLSQVAIFYVVFQIIMNQRIENFALFVFAGLIFWNVFAETTSRGMGLLLRQRQLYENTDMDKLEVFIATHLSASIGFAFNLAIFLVIAVLMGLYPNFYSLLVIPIYLNVIILTFGTTLILSNLYLFFQDMLQIWNIVIRIGFFMSPILFRGQMFQNKVPILMYLNPLSGIINNGRAVLMYGEQPDWSMMLFGFLYAFVILFIGLFLHKRISPYTSELI